MVDVYLLAKALCVNESWLMGGDVPMEKTLQERKNDPPEYIINTKGLTQEEIESIKRYVEFIKNEKKNDIK